MGILLADNNRAMVDIVISTEADRVTLFSAKEMSSYLAKICNTDFKIMEKEDCPAMTVRLLPVSTDHKLYPICQYNNPAHDAFNISADDNGVSVSGKNGRSVLYGVYGFLETLGCRFIEPGIETVPSTRTLQVKKMRHNFTAAFDLRNIFRVQIATSRIGNFEGLEPTHHLPQIDWMAKQRLNHYIFYVDYYRYDLWEKHKKNILDALLDRGFEIEVTHHSILYFCPPNENCDFGNYGASTYQVNHPDWYVPSLSFGAEYQARVEVPEVQKIVIERYLNYLRNNPEVNIAGLWPGDSSANKPDSELSHTDGYMKFWNNVCEELAKEFPRKKLCGLAYFELTKPPEKLTAAKNFHLWFCRHDDNYMYPITDIRNQKYYDFLKGWVQKLSPEQVACYHYYGWMPAFIPLTENMKNDLAVYREMKLAGVYGWSGFTFNIMGNNYRWARDLYVFSHLLWDTDQDVRKMEEDWANGVFKSAAPEIMEFYDALRRAHMKESGKGLLAREPWISLELLHNIQKILAQARSRVEEPEILHRVNLLEQVAASGSSAVIRREAANSIVRFF